MIISSFSSSNSSSSLSIQGCFQAGLQVLLPFSRYRHLQPGRRHAELPASAQRCGSKQSDIPVTIKSWLSCGCSELCCCCPTGLLAAPVWRLWFPPCDLRVPMGGTVVQARRSFRWRLPHQPGVARKHWWTGCCCSTLFPSHYSFLVFISTECVIVFACPSFLVFTCICLCVFVSESSSSATRLFSRTTCVVREPCPSFGLSWCWLPNIRWTSPWLGFVLWNTLFPILHLVPVCLWRPQQHGSCGHSNTSTVGLGCGYVKISIIVIFNKALWLWNILSPIERSHLSGDWWAISCS